MESSKRVIYRAMKRDNKTSQRERKILSKSSLQTRISIKMGVYLLQMEKCYPLQIIRKPCGMLNVVLERLHVKTLYQSHSTLNQKEGQITLPNKISLMITFMCLTEAICVSDAPRIKIMLDFIQFLLFIELTCLTLLNHTGVMMWFYYVSIAMTDAQGIRTLSRKKFLLNMTVNLTNYHLI